MGFLPLSAENLSGDSRRAGAGRGEGRFHYFAGKTGAKDIYGVAGV